MTNDKDKRIAELEIQVHELERDLIHDPLTGLKARAFFEEEIVVSLLGAKDLLLSELVKRADQALYRAKESGRNKVVAYGNTK